MEIFRDFYQIPGVNCHHNRVTQCHRAAGRRGVTFGQYNGVVILQRTADDKEVTGFFRIFCQPLVTFRVNRLNRTDLPVRVVQRNNQPLTVVNMYAPRGLNALFLQVRVIMPGLCCALISLCRCPGFLVMQEAGLFCTVPGLLGTDGFDMQGGHRIRFFTAVRPGGVNFTAAIPEIVKPAIGMTVEMPDV